MNATDLCGCYESEAISSVQKLDNKFKHLWHIGTFHPAFKEAGIYTNTNQTDILKSVSSHHTTAA